MSTVKPIPDTSSAMIPMLVCRDVAAEIDFCKTAFGAVELGRRPGPDGAVAHALMTISGAMVIVEAEWPTLASRAPQPDGSSPVVIYVYVQDVDAVVDSARGEEPVLGRPHRADYRSGGARVDRLLARRRNVVGTKRSALVRHREEGLMGRPTFKSAVRSSSGSSPAIRGCSRRR
jgi:uncharacterized glyoxalase superfamily protein PhnB